MDRVVLLLEVTADEADHVIAAVAQTPVRFMGTDLADATRLKDGLTGQLSEGAEVVHMACSDGVAATGEPRYTVCRRK